MKEITEERLEEIASLADKTLSNGTIFSPHAYMAVKSIEITQMARELLALRSQQPVLPQEICNRLKAEGVAEVLKDANEYDNLTSKEWSTLANNWHQTFLGLSLDAMWEQAKHNK